MFLEHAKEALAAHVLLPVIMASQPDPASMPSEGDQTSAHGPLSLRILSHLHGVVGMSPLDIILLLPTIIQLIQTLAGDFEAIVKFIQNLKKPAAPVTPTAQ